MISLLQRCFFYLFFGITLGPEPEVIDAVPADHSQLCVNCKVITPYDTQNRCPLCKSEAVMRLAPLLNKEEFVRPGMLKVAAVSFFQPVPTEKRNGYIDIRPIGTFN